MDDFQPVARAALAALLGVSLFSCHPRHTPRHWDTSQREFHFRGPAAIAVVNMPAVNRWADSAWLKVFLDHFNDAADSLERGGYAATVTFQETLVVIFPDTIVMANRTNPRVRDTVATDGSNVVRLASRGSAIEYYFVAPRRRPFSVPGGETAQRLLREWGGWAEWAWETLPAAPARDR